MTTPVIGWSAAQLAGRLLRESSDIADLGPIFAPQPPVKGYRHAVGVGLALRPANSAGQWTRCGVAQTADSGARLLATVEFLRRLKLFMALKTQSWGRMSMPCAWSKTVASARLTLLEGVGHMPHHSSQEAVLSTISRVYQRIEEMG